MQIERRTALVIGGWGLVGMAVCRELVSHNPERILILSLRESEARDAVAELDTEIERLRRIGHAIEPIELAPVWGNIFVRTAWKDRAWRDLFDDTQIRDGLIGDVLDELSEDILNHSFLYDLITTHRPHIIVDCVNTATAISYKDRFDVYAMSRRVRAGLRNGQLEAASVEMLLANLYVPQLIRHVQILHKAMTKSGAKIYVKIGTSGTGGMGLNIPYTHSEESPSRVLLSKSSVAGAHSLLLYLMGRTPKGPIIKEVKPTAAIAWKRITYGPVRIGGREVPLVDCPPERGLALGGELDLDVVPELDPLDSVLEDVYIDTGENGLFSREEFTAITTTGQMEYVTPEEIARNVVEEIRGGNTGHDIINALNNASMGPTYRAGFLRDRAIARMDELERRHGTRSVAFEMLGPPRLSKLLYEAHLLKCAYRTLDHVLAASPSEITNAVMALLQGDRALRSRIISIGIPILLADGRTLLRGPQMKVPPRGEERRIPLDSSQVDRFCHLGWLDGRESNWQRWQERFRMIQTEVQAQPADDSSSRSVRNAHFWDPEPGEGWEINVGETVGWIFNTEEQGRRGKE